MSKSAWGAAVSAFFAIVGIVAPIPDQLRLGIFVFALIGLVVSCVGWYCAHRKENKKNPPDKDKAPIPKRWVVGTAAGIGFSLALIALRFYLTTRPIAVYPLFSSVHQSRNEELGEPRTKAAQLYISYFAQYENATVIWIAGQTTYHGNLYVLGQTWESYPFPTFQYASTEAEESRWYSDDCNRARLHLPEDKLPPYAGLAQQWSRDQQNGTNTVKWVGARQWHVEYRKGVYIQEFDRGFIVGPFSPDQPSGSADDRALVFALTSNHKWFATSVESKLPQRTEIAAVNVPCGPESMPPSPMPTRQPPTAEEMAGAPYGYYIHDSKDLTIRGGEIKNVKTAIGIARSEGIQTENVNIDGDTRRSDWSDSELNREVMMEFSKHVQQWVNLPEAERRKRRQDFDLLEEKIKSAPIEQRGELVKQLRELP